MRALNCFLLLFFVICSPSVFSEELYHCKLKTHWKNFDDDEFKQKDSLLTFKIKDNNTISIFNHSIELTYGEPLRIRSYNPVVIAEFQDSDNIRLLVLDRRNNLATYSVTYINGNYGGEWRLGRCSPQY